MSSYSELIKNRADDIALPDLSDVLNFYSEVAPCGVIGSFLLDKTDDIGDCFNFKHHYITSAMDSGVTAALFTAMRCYFSARMLNILNIVFSFRFEVYLFRFVPLYYFLTPNLLTNAKLYIIILLIEYGGIMQ